MGNQIGRVVSEFEHHVTVHVGDGPGEVPRHLQFGRRDIVQSGPAGLVLGENARIEHVMDCNCPKPEVQMRVVVPDSVYLSL